MNKLFAKFFHLPQHCKNQKWIKSYLNQKKVKFSDDKGKETKTIETITLKKKENEKNELKTVRLTHDSQCVSSLLSSGPQFLIPSHRKRSDMQ